MEKLTPKRAELLYEIFAFITSFHESLRRSPSLEEIKKGVGCSRGTAQRYRDKLVEIECLKKIDNRTRSQYIPKKQLPDYIMSLIPNKIEVIGIIEAGPVTTTFTDEEPTEILVGDQVKKGDYGLRVNGESMIGASIRSGDYVWIRRSIDFDGPLEGQIVVARTDSDDLTLKYFYSQDNQVTLKAANPQVKDQTFDSDRVDIQGVLVKVVASEEVVSSEIDYLENIRIQNNIDRINKEIDLKEREIKGIDIANIGCPRDTRIQLFKWNKTKDTPYYKAVFIDIESGEKTHKYLGKKDSVEYLNCIDEVNIWKKLDLLEKELNLLKEERDNLLRTD
jgi:SOS-response transcriptional repressor LexA